MNSHVVSHHLQNNQLSKLEEDGDSHWTLVTLSTSLRIRHLALSCHLLPMTKPTFPPTAACLNPVFWLGHLIFGLLSTVAPKEGHQQILEHSIRVHNGKPL